MGNIAIVFHFGHAELCAMTLPELARWNVRAHEAIEKQD